MQRRKDTYVYSQTQNENEHKFFCKAKFTIDANYAFWL